MWHRIFLAPLPTRVSAAAHSDKLAEARNFISLPHFLRQLNINLIACQNVIICLQVIVAFLT